jgi:pimeloyl-ACP methyl ester carboxylesterase
MVSLAGSGPSRAARSLLSRPLAPLVSMKDRRPYEVGEFENDGVRLHYEIHGRGPRAVVLTHGILLDSRMNRRLASDLAERGMRVVLLDLPGHGMSEKPPHASAHRMDSYARHVISLMDALGIEQAAVGGVSLGANVALQAAVLAPERVRALVVEMPVLEWAVPGAAVLFVPLLLGVHYAAPVVRLVARVARHVPETGIGTLDSFVGTLRLEPEQAAAVLHGMLVGPITPTYEQRHAIAAPTLVIGHKVDFVHPFTDADHLTRQLPNARLVEAHSIIELRTTPARLTGEIADFLADAFGPWRLRRSTLSPNDGDPGLAGHG